MEDNIAQYLQKISIFRIGEVYSVDGRTVRIKVDRDKNRSHLLYQGEIVKNISVGGYLKILKGFDTIVCQVESEYLKEIDGFESGYHNKTDEFSRFLNVKLIGFFSGKEYFKGVKELPLIGNWCLLMDNTEFSAIHKFAKEDERIIELGYLLNDDSIPIKISINKLFSSHIGIFGNTGSGKSYTLASLYNKLFKQVSKNKKFKSNARFLLYDFNGEYSDRNVIINKKKVYKISTKNLEGDKIPLKRADLLNPELFNILANATEKTQQPFIKRALMLYNKVQSAKNPSVYIRGLLKKLVESVVCMSDAVKSKLLLDYFEQILKPNLDKDGSDNSILNDLQWHSNSLCYYATFDGIPHYFNSAKGKDAIPRLSLYKAASSFDESNNFIETIIRYLYIQLIQDVLNNRALNEHIHPAINKLKALMKDFEKVFIIDDDHDFWENHFFAVIDLNNANINIKKLIPLLLSFKLYTEHKNKKNEKLEKSLNIIIDEAHNILSYDSQRESESWKDFRLETFEEIIKEGRKFGVFMTIASQRPSDISVTIVSQLHNYLIHRLVNNKDLEMIEKAVAFLDKLSFETIPILPIGACVLSGIVADLPVIVQIDKLDKTIQPQSSTLNLEECWIDTK